MALFKSSASRLASRLAARTTLLLRADPGDALLDAADLLGAADLPAGEVAEVLRPYTGPLRAEDEAADTYTLNGSDTPFLVFFRSPRLYIRDNGPPAVGAMRSKPLYTWDLHAGVSPEDAGRETCLKVGNAALALASRSGGVAIDVLGFPVSSAEDLLPR